MSEDSFQPTTDNRQLATLFAITVLFLAVRITLAVVREPFFDELFTLWIAKKPLPELLSALRHDSGPPLFYLIAKSAFAIAGASVSVGRFLSLVCATVLLFALVAQRWGRGALVAGALLAVFPPHAYFAGEARSYSLCALFLGLAAVCLDRWQEMENRVALGLAVGAMVAAAASHYYGVLFFPAPLLLGVFARKRRAIIEGFIGSLGAGIIFAPGFLLASLQPREATAWFAAGSRFADLCLALGSLQHLGFAAPYPPLVVPPAPLWLQAISALAVVLAVIRTWRSPRAIRFAIMTLTPVALLGVFASIGRSIYFPVRFESVLALPFVVWVALAVEGWESRMRRVLVAVMLATGLISCAVMLQTHARRTPDAYRSAALWMRDRVDPRSTIVASGYAFLEIESQVDPSWQAHVTSFPSAQAIHPGWRAQTEPDRLEKELDALRFKRGDAFIWVGDEHSEEAAVISRKAKVRVLRRDRGIIVYAVNS